ncbi:MAG: EscU/YscU/HrcU family type III secretion system export apparatus switch protein [Notoacmeibacter sp.]
MSDSEDDDHDDKPLDASDKRLSTAREEGNQPFAREAPIVAMLLALAIGIGSILMPMTSQLTEDLALLLAKSGEIKLGNSQDLLLLAWHVVSGTGAAVAPFLLLFIVGGILASVLQNPPQVLASRIAPKFSHISPMAGFSRIFGSAGLVEFAKAIGKVGLVGLVIFVVLYGSRHQVASMLLFSPENSLHTVFGIIFQVVRTVLGAAAILLVADLFWSRHQWSGRLKMTHQEMKDEMKESDGDPHMKAKRLAKQRQTMTRMMAEVPNATMVITNPTHYAVALKYSADGAGVPQVVAKGTDEIARRIKELATQNRVPIVEDVPLARALHKSVDIGQFIPREFFQAIAEIVHIISSRKGGFGQINHKRASKL